MRLFEVIFVLVSALLFTVSASVDLVNHITSVSSVIPGSYVVTLEQGLSEAAVRSHHAWVSDLHMAALMTSNAEADESFEPAGIEKVYQIRSFNAYAGSFFKETIEKIRFSADVRAVEVDTIWQVAAPVSQANVIDTEQNTTWGLAAMSNRWPNPPMNFSYDSSAGRDSWAYVVDSGINIPHVEFGGRAYLGYNAVNGTTHDDRLGHGTHVAGIMGSTTYGVAKLTSLISVKVFEGDSSPTSTILDGYTWAVRDILYNNRTNASVINLSCGGPNSVAFQDAIVTSYGENIVTTVAAMNNNDDVANYSPANTVQALTIAAIDNTYTRASYSNYGDLVDIFAPGSGILSTWIGSDTATALLSGTSMASPFVGGLVVYLRVWYQGDLAGSETLCDRLNAMGSNGVVQNAGPSTANLLAYNGAGLE